MYGRALRGELSPRAAIKAKCYECCAWERHEGGDDRIGGCAVRGCPLWALRPFQQARESLYPSDPEGLSEEGAADGAQAGTDLPGANRNGAAQ